MAAKELGAKVLTKIEHLITEIDKAAPPSTRQRQANFFLQQVEQDQKDEKSQIYSKMSYAYRKKEKKVGELLKDNIYQQQGYHQRFKIKNKNTLKILNKKEMKPIHERVDQIIAKKKRNIKGIQAYYQEKQKGSMKPLNHIADQQKDKKFNYSQLEEYCFELDEKNKERIKKKHMRKLHLVKIENQKIPRVDKMSRSLSVMRNVKKNYSENVFARMEQYSYQQRKNKRQLIQHITQQQGNFSPVLCSKSIQLAAKLKRDINKSQRSFYHQSRCQFQRQSSSKEKRPVKQDKSIPKTIEKTKIKINMNSTPTNVKKTTPKNNKSNKSFERSTISKNVSPLKQKNSNPLLKQTPKTTTPKKIQTVSKSPTIKKHQKQN